MKALFWVGVVVLIVGIVSLFLPVPRDRRAGWRSGGVSVGVETRHEAKVSPFVSAVMIAGGISMMATGRMKS